MDIREELRVDAIAIQFSGADQGIAAFNIDLEVEADIGAVVDNSDIRYFAEGPGIVYDGPFSPAR